MSGPYKKNLKRTFAEVHTDLVEHHAREFGRGLALCAQAIDKLQKLESQNNGGVASEVSSLLSAAKLAVNDFLGE